MIFPFRCTSLVLLCSALMGSYGASRSLAQPADRLNALVFSKTAEFRHASIPDGIEAIQALGTEHGFEVDATEDASSFTGENLDQYSVVIFLNTTGDVLNEQQQAAFEQYVQAGGGYVGVHSASDTEYDWNWYGDLVGAYFESHPSVQEATVTVEDQQHPSTEMLPDRWTRTDEWYNFRSNPRGDVHVLVTLDEETYSGGEDGHDHPIAWCQPYLGGRSWYTAGGHTSEAFDEPLFRDHLLGGIRYAAGEAGAGSCEATDESNFGRTILDDNPSNPMELGEGLKAVW